MKPKNHKGFILKPLTLTLMTLFPVAAVNAATYTAQGNVYDINPLRTPVLTPRTLNNLTNPDSLSGKYIYVVDSKNDLAVRDPINGFAYLPGDPLLAQVMAYYHIDQYRNYINSLGIYLPPNAPIQVDVHAYADDGLSELVGAAYGSAVFGWPGAINIGSKNKIDRDGDWISDEPLENTEMALNADVLVHEYAHAVTDYLRLNHGGYSSLPGFMQEGWADYLMCSWLKSPMVGDWTDRGGYREYRRTLAGNIGQLDLWPATNIRANDGIPVEDYNNARKYHNSMVWSGGLWELRERISRLAGTNGIANYNTGSVLADRLVLTAMPLFNASGQSDADPVSAIAQGVSSLKQALAQLQANPSYTTAYQNITDTDIDLAFSSRFPKSARTSQDVSSDEREHAWRSETGRKDVNVAVFDTGISVPQVNVWTSFDSEDLNLNGKLDDGEDKNGNQVLDKGNIAYGWDYINNQPAPIDVVTGPWPSHGDSVAMYLAATANNKSAAPGVAWNTSLWILRVTSSDGTVPNAFHNQYSGEAFRFAIDRHLDVVNYSRGAISDTGTWEPANAFHMPMFQEIQEGNQTNFGQGKDTIVVAAVADARNNPPNLDNDVSPIYPASYPLPNIISVTTCDGFNGTGQHNVDICTDRDETSWSAPEVSGALALLLSKQKDRQEAHPGYRAMTTGEIKYHLLMSTDHVALLEGKTVSEGAMNVNRLLEYYEVDSDWDGYSDKIEALFGTDPNDQNSHPDMNGDDDEDGLSNGLELAYGTIPIPAYAGVDYRDKLYPIYLDYYGQLKQGITAGDSDGDGIGDYAEAFALNGYYTDPANADTNGNGVMDGADSVPSLFKVNVSNQLALNKPTTASDTSYKYLFPANYATDGDPETAWQSTNSGGSHWLTVDLGDVARVHATRFQFDTSYSYAADYKMQFSVDGNFSNSDTRVVNISGNTLRDRTDTFDAPIRARYVRFLITSPTGAGNYFRVKEFAVHGEMPSNIAISKKASASDVFYGQKHASYAVDGDPSTYWQTAANVSSPHWLKVDLGAASSINSMATHFDSGYNVASDFTLQFSNTGDFSATGSAAPYEVHITNNASPDPVSRFDSPVKARYVRLLVNQPTSGFFRVKELEINGSTP